MATTGKIVEIKACRTSGWCTIFVGGSLEMEARALFWWSRCGSAHLSGQKVWLGTIVRAMITKIDWLGGTMRIVTREYY